MPGRTQADGTFEISLSSADESALDIEIFDASEQLREFVDFGKLEKPAYLEIATEQSLVRNRLRAGQSELTGTGEANKVDNKGGPVSLFDLNILDTKLNYVLENGVIPVDGKTRTVYELLKNPQDGPPLFLPGDSTARIRVAADGMWWWTYAVHWGYPLDGTYYFRDQSPDDYSLWVTGLRPVPLNWYKVSYRSRAPRIVRVSRDVSSAVN